ncbi:uncharacterized protein J7T54_000559 [Emericellopsis cladophorae]|uniref:Uncharacterized protein n=1 Tax=Emericellopsis cladophorae TaxID=2686198 RepID=A0A9P9XUA1_9HYPO|nr:uncharacterized protein J7T54_000559 [Emericellopsis cladophorae]KAI6777850.1 hypothetical protein J7T54_000559 [Emericellopsis cladophorae]
MLANSEQKRATSLKTAMNKIWGTARTTFNISPGFQAVGNICHGGSQVNGNTIHNETHQYSRNTININICFCSGAQSHR